MNLKPMNDWTVIRPTDAAEKTAGGLYIPDSAKEKPHEGVVEAIGPGAYEEEKYGRKKDDKTAGKKERKFIPTSVKPGDLVLYEHYAGQTYTIGGEDLVLVREKDILGTLSGAGRKPLELPVSTTGGGTTALVKKVSGKEEKGKKAAAKKTGKKK